MDDCNCGCEHTLIDTKGRYPLIADCAKCQDCRDPVHDFHAPDDLWMEVVGDADGVLCWDCFADRANRKGVWRLMPVVMTHEEFDSWRRAHEPVKGAAEELMFGEMRTTEGETA